MDMDADKLLDALGMNESKKEETKVNKSLMENLRQVVEEGGLLDTDAWSKTYRSSVYDVATCFPKKSVHHRRFFMTYVAKDEVSKHLFNICFDFFKKNWNNESVDAAEFEAACGIGVEVSEAEVEAAITSVLDSLPDADWSKYGMVMGTARKKVPFAESKLVKNTTDRVFNARFGDRKAAQAKKKKEPKKPKAKKQEAVVEEDVNDTLAHVKFHKPEENIQVTDEILQEHLNRTSGKVITRFPPEPNGYLHLGHCKSMNLNFGYANREGGICYLRFDDTNPVTEKHEYIDTIVECVEWMGFKPHKITYSSDYFPNLFQFALQLIENDKAYVCHETAEEMHEGRENLRESKWRNRPTSESMKLFLDMKKGKFEEGTATLRLKADMKSPNPNLRDPVAYRIKYHPHPRTGNTWCIYPTYDYTHCICDSLEDITHSLCTLEFDVRRASYEWLIRAIGIYCPPQIEFSRLNVTRFMMSKRRIIKLVNSGVVRGWDDPRLATIVGLRRRGYTPAALKDLCERVGISRNANLIAISLLEDCLRQDLNKTAPRAMAVLDPVRVVCENWPEDKVITLDVPNFPAEPEKGTHSVPFSRVFYIDGSDFREDAAKDYFRLAPGKSVGLRHFTIEDCNTAMFEYVSHRSEEGKVVEVVVKMNKLDAKPKKAHYIQWVAEPAPGTAPKAAEFRLYEDLFLVDKPSELGDDWMDAINPTSETVINGYVDPFAEGASKLEKFQFERSGFYCADQDTTDELLVFNRAVTLKDTNRQKS